MISILIIIIAIFLIINLILFIKYRKLKKSIQEYKSIGTGRYGFYNFKKDWYTAIVYVNEIDRYTNGFCVIKINSIETTCRQMYHNDTIEMIRNSFITLRKVSDIEWLESEENIKKIRKEKLEKILK